MIAWPEIPLNNAALICFVLIPLLAHNGLRAYQRAIGLAEAKALLNGANGKLGRIQFNPRRNKKGDK